MAIATTTTARQIITKAMQQVGILTKTEQPDADEANDALESMNDMLSSWSNDSGMIYVRTWEEFDVTAGQTKYTIGPLQNFNTIRPINIVAGHIRWNNIDYPMTKIPDEVYTEDIPQKTLQSIPEYYNYDNGYPTGIIRLFPVPQVAGMKMFILSEKELSQFTLDTTIILPAGWKRALVFNLAVEIAGEYQLQVPPTVQDIANKSKGAIQRTILKNRSMDATPAGGARRRDIASGRI